MRQEQLVATGCILAFAVAVSAVEGGAQPAAAISPNRVIVSPLVNKTGSARFRSVGAEAAAAISAMLTAEKVAEVASDPKDRSAAVRVDGSYTGSDGQLAFTIRFTDGSGKKVLGSLGPVPGAAGTYTQLAEQTTAALDGRRRWGDVNLGWPPPASWAAWKDAQTAWEVFNTGNWAGALTHFQNVEKLDPNYVNAKYGIWVSNGNMGRTAQRDSMNAVVKPLMTAVPGLLNDVYSWLNASNTRDWETMYQVGRRLAANDERGGYSQALPANHTGRFTEVVALFNARDTSANTRGWRPWETNVMFAMHSLGQFSEAAALSRSITETRGLDFVSANLQLYNLAASGRFNDVEDLLARVNTLPITAANTYGGSLNIVGWEYRAHGFEQQARDVFRRRLAFYKALTPDQQRTYSAAMTSAFLNAGEYGEARTRYEALLATAPDNLAYWNALGVVAAQTGDDELMIRVENRLAGETRPQSKSDALYFRAGLAATRGDCATAERLLREGFAVGITRWDYSFHWTFSTGKGQACTTLPSLYGPRQ